MTDFFVPVPTLHTRRLRLRPLEAGDAADYARHFVDYAVIGPLAHHVPWPYPDDGVDAYLRRELPRQGKGRWTWAITLPASDAPGALVGCIGLWKDGTPEHRGFWLGRAHWGRGLMTEAAEAVNACAFEALGFETLVFSNAVGNAASRRVKEKTGARLVRVEPAAFVDPRYVEREIWELTRADWEAQRAPAGRAGVAFARPSRAPPP